MARFTVDTKSSDFSMQIKKGPVFLREGNEAGFWGRLSTIKCAIEPSTRHDKYRLMAQFNPEKSPKEQGRVYSRGGFWAGTHDLVKSELGGKYFSSCEGVDERTGFQIDITQWKWGNQPEITVKREGDGRHSRRIWFTFVNRPYFGYPENDQQEVRLRFTLLGAPASSSTFEIIKKIDVVQQHDDVFGHGDGEKLDYLYDYGALNLEGEGNSVHPKQLYTCNALLRTIEDYFPKNKKINIGYIGPDTTENLRSVIRILTNHEGLRRKKYGLHVIYEEDWDIPVAEHPFENTQYDLSRSKLKPNKMFVSEIISGKRPLPQIDVLLATYVGPWAVFTSQRSKDNYETLLNQIITEKTVFITVDPIGERSAVISHYKPTEIYGSKVNLSDFYRSLNLSEEKMPWQQSCEPSVKVMRWKKEVKP